MTNDQYGESKKDSQKERDRDSTPENERENKRRIQNRNQDTSIEGQFQDRGKSHERDEKDQ
jgi:hypothetical protein